MLPCFSASIAASKRAGTQADENDFRDTEVVFQPDDGFADAGAPSVDAAGILARSVGIGRAVVVEAQGWHACGGELISEARQLFLAHNSSKPCGLHRIAPRAPSALCSHPAQRANETLIMRPPCILRVGT